MVRGRRMIKRLLESLDDYTEIAFTRMNDRYFVKVMKWVKNIPYSRSIMVHKEDFRFIDEIIKEELGVEILGEDNEAIPVQFLKDWSEQNEYDETKPRTIPLVLSAWEDWRKENENDNI